MLQQSSAFHAMLQAQEMQQSSAFHAMLQAQEMQDLNAKLLARAREVEQKHGLLLEQFPQMNACLKQKTRENERLQAEVERLKSTITVRHLLSRVLGPHRYSSSVHVTLKQKTCTDARLQTEIAHCSLDRVLQERMGVMPEKDGLPSTSQHANTFSAAQQEQQAPAALPAMPSTTVTSGEDTHPRMQRPLRLDWHGMARLAAALGPLQARAAHRHAG